MFPAVWTHLVMNGGLIGGRGNLTRGFERFGTSLSARAAVEVDCGALSRRHTAMLAEIPSRQVAQPGGGCEVTCYVTDRQLGRRRAATALSESSVKGRSLIIPAEDGVVM